MGLVTNRRVSSRYFNSLNPGKRLNSIRFSAKSSMSMLGIVPYYYDKEEWVKVDYYVNNAVIFRNEKFFINPISNLQTDFVVKLYICYFYNNHSLEFGEFLQLFILAFAFYIPFELSPIFVIKYHLRLLLNLCDYWNLLEDYKNR